MDKAGGWSQAKWSICVADRTQQISGAVCVSLTSFYCQYTLGVGRGEKARGRGFFGESLLLSERYVECDAVLLLHNSLVSFFVN